MTVQCKTTIIAILLIAGIADFSAFMFAGAKNSEDRIVPKRVVLSWYDDPSTTASITWRTDQAEKNAAVQYQKADARPLKVSAAKKVKAVSGEVVINRKIRFFSHSVKLRGLNPDTVYAYRVGSPGSWTEWFHFRTGATIFKPFNFIFLGDIQNNIYSMCSRVIRAAVMSSREPRFILHAGDLVSSTYSDPMWGEWFRAGGWIYKSVPQLAVPGNHEYMGESRINIFHHALTPMWRCQFTFPENGPRGLKETVYSLDFQGVRLVALNPNEKLPEQAEWLQKILKNCDSRWKIVFMHQPVYSTGLSRDNRKLRETLVPIFDRYEVDLVLQGHDHSYGRTFKLKNSGICEKEERGTYYVVSVAGPKQYRLNPKFRKLLAKTDSGSQLFQLVRVEYNRLLFETRTADGRLFDHFTIKKSENRVK